MKVAFITTTVNVPHVLKLYRKLDPSVFFFVAADMRTPLEAYQFCADIPDCEIYSPDRQKELGYECSPLLGWSTISRRNIALLEALKWGADVIVTIDDDNIPLGPTYRFDFTVDCLHDGLVASSDTGWFDVGTLLDPVASHRGFPHTKASPPVLAPITDAKIGVAAGICLGDPDVSAVMRIANHPTVHRASELLRAGIVTDPKRTWTVFNSQNTAFIRELAPCFLMVPQFGRYDDIFASLIAQRVMGERDLYVHFGQPFVWQQRNEHDLLKDLKAEQWGAENIVHFSDYLGQYVLQGKTIAEQVADLYADMGHGACMPAGVADLGEAWCEDCAKVMGL
jgi:hypothetical protein